MKSEQTADGRGDGFIETVRKPKREDLTEADGLLLFFSFHKALMQTDTFTWK